MLLNFRNSSLNYNYLIIILRKNQINFIKGILKNYLPRKNQNVFQTCVLDKKIQRKKTHFTFLKF